MKKVIVQYDNEVKTFNDVTKVKCLFAFDMFENTIKIFQSRKVTTINEYEIIGFEVVEQ